ncbi:hypothetical protein HN51_045513 [Arachis hypogaea]
MLVLLRGQTLVAEMKHLKEMQEHSVFKTYLNLLMSRIKLLQNKRDAQLKQMLSNSCRLAKRQLLEFGVVQA